MGGARFVGCWTNADVCHSDRVGISRRVERISKVNQKEIRSTPFAALISLGMTEKGGGETNGAPNCRGGEQLLGETIPSVTASLCHLPLLRGGLMSAEDDREWRMSAIGAPICRGEHGSPLRTHGE